MEAGKILILLIASFGLSFSSELSSDKESRFLGLFSVLNFDNEECQSSDAGVLGTCFTTEECQTNGGNVMGNCASGFGVCCVFVVNACSGTVTRNISYITSPNFPTSFTTAGNCDFTIQRANSDVCQLRLDFKTLVLTEPTDGKCGTNNVDKLTITTPAGGLPTGVNGICGDNLNGNHMYIDTGSTGNVMMSVNIGSNSGARNWKIRVTQYECTSTSRAPVGCLQYYKGISNVISSYNAAGEQFLAGLSYNNCIRMEAGMCSIQYAAISFGLVMSSSAKSQDNAIGCANTAVIIPSSPTEHCGGRFSAAKEATENGVVTSDLKPFRLGVKSLDVAIAAGEAQGFMIRYTQIPC